MVHPHIQRAQLLMEQSRFEMAERELRGALAQDPDDPFAHALLAICLAQANKTAEAIAACRRAISLAPDMPFAHYALSAVLHDEERFDESLVAANEAIRLDPFEPRHFSLLASIHVGRKRWKDALTAAEQGLAIDAEDTRCANMRAIALTQLGRRAEAGQTIDAALARNPEDATSHANMGWTLLHQRQPRKAMEHFAEALRLEPHNEWARTGIVEAMKARNIIYRWFLAYVLFMSRLQPGTQIALLVGLLVGVNIIARLPLEGPLLLVTLLVVLGYFGLVLTAWIASPLFNLLLRLDHFGRLVLSRDERQDTNWLMLALLVIGGLCVATIQLRPFDVINYLMLTIAVGVTLSVPRHGRRNLAAAITCGLIAVAAWYCYGWLSLSPAADFDLAFAKRQDQLRQVFAWGSAAMTWFAGILRTAR